MGSSEMSKKFLPTTLAALLLLLAPHAVRAQTCGSPATCSGTQNASALTGSYACVGVQADAGNGAKVSVTTFGFDGAGNVAIERASNNNQSTTSTYSDFATMSGSQYCLNADNVTGIVFLSGAGSCPLTFAVGGGGKSLRVISSEQNKVSELTCAHQ